MMVMQSGLDLFDERDMGLGYQVGELAMHCDSFYGLGLLCA